jgi:hypothetical protein
MSAYALAADALLIIHSLLVLFIVGGLALVIIGCAIGWSWVRNPWFRLLHLLAIAVVVLQAWAGRICPLTTWEMALRDEAGQSTYHTSFIAHWLGRLLYYDAPPWVFVVLYSGFGLIVLLTWWWVRPRPFRGP